MPTALKTALGEAVTDNAAVEAAIAKAADGIFKAVQRSGLGFTDWSLSKPEGLADRLRRDGSDTVIELHAYNISASIVLGDLVDGEDAVFKKIALGRVRDIGEVQRLGSLMKVLTKLLLDDLKEWAQFVIDEVD